jgi:uncharacterized Fe-S cluster protein YjdI
MPSGIVKRYSNGEITIIWKPDLCCHSTICYTELPDVFDPSSRPWIKPQNASTEKIIKVVKSCPTNALTFEMDKPAVKKDEAASTEKKPAEVHLIKNGPVKIKCASVLYDENGKEYIFDQPIALCRCHKSANFPFCDGSHGDRE